MNNTREDKINIYDAVLFAAKFLLIAALVFAAVYWLNAVMTDFIAEEEAERARQRAKELEWLKMQEDYDRERATAHAFADITCHYDGQFLEIFEKHVSADYIFLGTSHITHGVTPEAFEKSGKKFFNFALNGSNPSYYVWWYNDVFKPNNYVKPKAVIFGVNWFMFDTGWLWRRPEFDLEYLNRVSLPPPSDGGDGADFETPANQRLAYTGSWFDIDSLVTYVTNRFPVLSARDRFIELILPEAKEESEETEFVLETYESEHRVQAVRYGARERCRLDLFYKGFAPYQADFEGHHAGTAGTNFRQEEEDAFISLLNQFKAEGIPVIFVMAPEYLPGRTAPQFEELTDKLYYIAA